MTVQSFKYFFSAVSVVPSNLRVGSSSRVKVYFFLFSTCTEELISTTKLIQFLSNPLPTEQVYFLSNPIPYPELLYLSMSGFLVNLTAAEKQFSNVGLLLLGLERINS